MVAAERGALRAAGGPLRAIVAAPVSPAASALRLRLADTKRTPVDLAAVDCADHGVDVVDFHLDEAEPRERPVSRSVTTRALLTSPWALNNPSSSPSPMLHARFPTNSLTCMTRRSSAALLLRDREAVTVRWHRARPLRDSPSPQGPHSSNTVRGTARVDRFPFTDARHQSDGGATVLTTKGVGCPIHRAVEECRRAGRARGGVSSARRTGAPRGTA